MLLKTMSGLLSRFVSKAQTKHWQNLQRRTQKLHRAEQEHLMEFLEDHLVTSPSSSSPGGGPGGDSSPLSGREHDANDIDDDINNDSDNGGGEEDSERKLQRDLDAAIERLGELESKHGFVRKRLEAYESKIGAAEDRLADLPADRRAAAEGRIESHRRALEPVRESCRSIAAELAVQERRIASMQDRRLDLRLKTEECRVVLEELSHSIAGTGGGPATTTAAPYSDDPVIVAELSGPEPSETAVDAGSAGDDDVENAIVDGTDDGVEPESPPNDRHESETTDEDNIELLSVPVGAHAGSE